ncbi:MAG: molybdate ABC transporter permease subunit [Acidobacteriota bacterium]|nr:molybdate ABC transporter permease subunit [Acidobacteriota bacterium]
MLRGALVVSLKVALLSLVLIAVPGIVTGWLLARKDFRGKSFLEAVIHAPLVLPPVITGYVLLLALGRKGWIGHWLDTWLGVSFSFNTAGAVLAAAVMSFPLLVRSARLGVELVDPGLETAAASLGASPLYTFLRVTLPLALPGILTGLTLAFARSLGEFGATIIFAGNIEGETRSIPLAMFTLLQQPGEERTVFLLALLAVGLSLLALTAADWGSRRLQQRYRGPA